MLRSSEVNLRRMYRGRRLLWRSYPVVLLGDLTRRSKGRRPLGEAWLRMGAIIAEFNISSYGVAC